MKRQLLLVPGKQLLGSWCCPGHDAWPHETYKNKRSKQARARDIKKEHQLARTLEKRELNKELKDIDDNGTRSISGRETDD